MLLVIEITFQDIAPAHTARLTQNILHINAMPAVMSTIGCLCVSKYILSGDMPELPQQ